MGNTCSNRRSNRWKCTGNRSVIDKSDLNQSNKYSTNSNIYSNTIIRFMYRSNIHGNSNSESEAIHNCDDINYMQWCNIYSYPCKWYQWSSSGRYNLYMGNTCSNRRSNRWKCTGNRSVIDKPDINQPNKYRKDSNIYSNTIIRSMYRSNIHGNSNSESEAVNNCDDINYMQWCNIYSYPCKWYQWSSSGRYNLYMGNTCSNRRSNRWKRTGNRSVIDKSDLNQPNKYSADSNIYSNTIIRIMYRSNIHGNSYSKSKAGNNCDDINYMQWSNIYSYPCKWYQWSSSGRYNLYMGNTCSNRRSNRWKCTGNRSVIDKSDLNQPNKYSTNSDIYSNTDIRIMYRSNIHGNSNSESEAIHNCDDINYMQWSNIYSYPCKWYQWSSSGTYNLDMGNTCSNRRSNRWKCTGNRSVIDKSDLNQSNKYSTNSDIYSNTDIRIMSRSNIHGNSNSESKAGNNCDDINYMQWSNIYSYPCKWYQWSSSGRYNLYMGNTCSNRRSNRWKCTGNRSVIDKSDLNQSNKY